MPKATVEDVRRAYEVAHGYRSTLTRYERAAILNRAAAPLRERTEEASDLITLESGLSKKDSIYEIGRVADVLGFAATRERCATMARCSRATSRRTASAAA
ncbi:aldehyde dehydrogenase family protein [Cupriavidus basilensis]